MAATAPKCNVTVFAPPANPLSPSGLRQIPPSATLQEAIRIINDNNSARTQAAHFDRLLNADLNRPPGKREGGFQAKPSQVRRAAQDEISKLHFKQIAIVRKKIRVENPDDKDQYVIDNRVVSMVMKDGRTNALWVFEDKKAAKGISAGSEESIAGEGG